MARVRHILAMSPLLRLTRPRTSCRCGQADGGFAMFNTSDGNMICMGIPKEVKKAMSKKTLPECFDSLFALTHGLKSYDFWMNDNECWGLARSWRSR